MPTRFEIERAVLRSTLPPRCRHLMHVLCVRIDAGTNTILPGFQPSLTELARDTGRDRRTVERDLNVLERDGWVIRRRPPIALARRVHARTNYTLLIPASNPQARDLVPPGARGNRPQALGAGSPKARGHAPLRSSGHQKSSGNDLNAIIETIRDRTGVDVDAAWAERVREQIIGDRNVGDVAAYVRATIERAPAGTYVPTSQPPPVSEVLRQLKSKGEIT